MEFKQFINSSNLSYNEYQNTGVQWCSQREKDTTMCKGGIIADEMGLGKTIMMIGNILQNFSTPNLIVLPVVLLEQWKEQFKKTTGHVPVVFHGTTLKKLTSETLQRTPIVLTTYGTLVSDSKRNGILGKVSWKRVIYDEAHHMRNRTTKVSKVARDNIKSEIKWLITGTPIQNHINDLYSLFEIMGIDKKKYTDPEILRDIVANLIMKRTKKEVGINLPSLNRNKITTKWSCNNERDLTEMIHNNVSKNKELILAMMMFERMMCVYPELAKNGIKKLKTEYGFDIDTEKLKGTNKHSKLDDVIRTLKERKNNNNKKIVFTSFRGEIDFLKSSLEEDGIFVEYIDGRISKKQRKRVIDNPCDVLIIQIRTGCEGLNLQEYNEVYFVTPDWNPQAEEQAIARCHRIGQTKEVEVFRFIMDPFDEDSKTTNIEMYSEKIQEAKKNIAEKIA